MKRFCLALALVALGLSVSACANFRAGVTKVGSALSVAVGATVTQKQAATLLAAYNTAESVAVQYLAQAPCKATDPRGTPCRDKAVAARINAILDEGDPRADTLLADIKSARASCAAMVPPTPPDKCTIGVASEAFNLLLASKDRLATAQAASSN